jgi:Zn-dependent peptidase ImmA (M78 family)/transcriptional regulator with XRE-family HTH domain
MPAVSTKVLVWARESSGLSQDEVAKKLGWKSPERLARIEAGELQPTRANLVKFAEVYRKPVLVFYLPEPPKEVRPVHDFRTLSDVGTKSEIVLDTLVKDISARQELLRSALEEAEEVSPLRFVNSIRRTQNPADVAGRIAEIIRFTGDDYAKMPSVDDAFKQLRQAVEDVGVFVLLASNLGSHHTDIGPSVFRGFSFADPLVPIIVINPKDSRSAWAFTLIHELTHILIGQSALSGYQTNARTEKFCDEVAASFLIKNEILKNHPLDRSDGIASLAISVGELASARNLSRKMIAYNFLSIGRISDDEYRTLSALFDAQRRIVEKPEDDEGGGPSYYVVRRHRLGKRLLSTVERLVSQGTLSTTRAGQVLGVKPTAIFKTFDGKLAA